jgi:alpha-tubulin suppressor-like RCC1 family protein/uncharacterized protein (DUF2141 family)
VTLTATAVNGSIFAGWSGACTGTGTCQVTMSAAKSVTATFNASSSGSTNTLTVSKSGNGSGTVTSTPAGINCGSDCSENYSANTNVTLTAAAVSGSTFAGWSGASCTGTGTCQVTMSTAKSVTATFNAGTSGTTYSLSVSKSGNGSGTVSSTPAGINCGSDCSENYSANANVTLTAAAVSGSTFAGWSGASCTGTGTCQVTMSAAKSVTAIFNTLSSMTGCVSQISAGQNHMLIMKNDGTVWAWGENEAGQLGTGDTVSRSTPVQIGSDYAQISAGGYRSSGIRNDGSLWTWGVNEWVLGWPTGGAYIASPEIRVPSTKFRQISSGYHHSMALDSEYNLWVWGENGAGELGNGSSSGIYTNNPTKTPYQFLQVSAGGDSYSLGLAGDSSLWVWGSNRFGQLGDGTIIDRYSPTKIGGGFGENFEKISAGFRHALAVHRGNNAVDAWGDNQAGELGDGTIYWGIVGNKPKYIGAYKDVSAGLDYSIALMQDGSLWQWGMHNSTAFPGGYSVAPRKIGDGFVKISAGGTNALAIKDDGSLYIWGANNLGQLGDGTTINSAVPKLLMQCTQPPVTASSYKLIQQSMTWSDAKGYCENIGAHLLTINSQQEQDYITSVFGSDIVWLGATDAGHEGLWTWVTGEPFTYENWETLYNEPNGGTDENYLMMGDGYDGGSNWMNRGKWNDTNGTGVNKFICEGKSPSMSLRDAIYLYNQPLNSKGDKVLVGVDCDVFELAVDVTSGYTNLAMGQASTLSQALTTQVEYADRINDSDAMFAYALYENQPVKTFTFNNQTNLTSSNQMGTATVFGYCYSSNPNAHVYFHQKDTCTNTYSDDHTTSCGVADNGNGGGSGGGMRLRDAIYLYGQDVDGKGSKILAGENCDVFQLLLDVNSGYADLAMAQQNSINDVMANQVLYPDRILDSAAMFSYALYDDKPVKAFVFGDRDNPSSTNKLGKNTIFGYCYSTNQNAEVYFRERDKCTDKSSSGLTYPIQGCVP